MVNNNSYTYLSAFLSDHNCSSCYNTQNLFCLGKKFQLPGLKPWCGYTIARCKGPVLYPSCHARMKKSITLFHIMSCMLHYFYATCGSQVGHSYGGLHQSGLFCGSVGQIKECAMIPALISKGMQAMHHDRSINQTFFEESKCNNPVVQKRQKTSGLLYNSINLNETL